MFKNQLQGSPARFTQVDLWDEIIPAEPRVFSRLGGNGHLFTQDAMNHGLAPSPKGGFVYVRFDGELRVDSAVTTTVQYQTIELDAQGRALVIGGSGDRLYVVDRDASARCVGIWERAKFYRVSWLSFGFAALDRSNVVTLFRYGEEGLPEPLASYQFDYVSAMDSPGDDTLAVATSNATLVHARSDGSLRELARIKRDLATSFQCTEETGRHLVRLRARHITEGGDALAIEGLDAAIAMRDELPMCARGVLFAEPCVAGSDLPPANQSQSPRREAPTSEVDLARLPRYTRALVSKIVASPKRAPSEQEIALLALPMPVDLRGYIQARLCRATESVSVYEAWLYLRPAEQNNVRARREGRGSVSIALGTIANGDPIYAVLRGSDAVIVELSHEEDSARTFRSFESWLVDVCARAEDNEQEHGLEDALR